MCLCIINEVPDYEIVVCISHTVDNGEFILRTLHIVINASCRRCYLKSFLKSLIGKIGKVFLVILISFRHFINRKMDGIKIIFGMTHVRDLSGVIHSFGKLWEKASHLCL